MDSLKSSEAGDSPNKLINFLNTLIHKLIKSHVPTKNLPFSVGSDEKQWQQGTHNGVQIFWIWLNFSLQPLCVSSTKMAIPSLLVSRFCIVPIINPKADPTSMFLDKTFIPQIEAGNRYPRNTNQQKFN